MSRHNFQSSQRQPLLWAACAFACGIVLARYCWRPAAWLVIAALALLSAVGTFMWKRTDRMRDRAAALTALCFFVVAGAFAGHARGEEHVDAQALQPYTTGSEMTVTAYLTREG